MTLRFVLVSAVASLGLSFPREAEVRSWMGSAQAWVNAKLAEWDARCAGEAREAEEIASIETIAGAVPGGWNESFQAVMEEMVRSFAGGGEPSPAPSFEPLAVGDDLYPGMAFALNRASEGLAPAALASEVAAPEAAAVAEAGEKPEAPRAEFEPMTVADDRLYAGLAYALNRQADGLSAEPAPALATAASEGPAPAGRASQFTVALRKTKEAVYAWSNLLHGPAVVAIAR